MAPVTCGGKRSCLGVFWGAGGGCALTWGVCVGGWLVVCGVEPGGSDWAGACALVAVAVDAEGLCVVEV